MKAPQVDEALTQKVANLARIELNPSELTKVTEQFQKILSYVDQLSEVDVAGIEALIHPTDFPIQLREDVADAAFLNSEGHPRVLDNAPETLYDGYKVPPIL